MEFYKNLNYQNDSNLQTLDLFLTDSEKENPLIVFIHGGGWSMGDKSDGQVNFWKEFLNFGYNLASINYRLAPKVNFPDSFLDLKLALNFLVENSSKFKINPDRITLAGSSAGGYFALLYTLSKQENPFKIKDEKEIELESVVAWYPPLDFTLFKNPIFNNPKFKRQYIFYIRIIEDFFGKKLRNLTNEDLKEASPFYYINSNIPPILIQQGLNDSLVPYEQTKIFHKKVKENTKKLPITIEFFENAEHCDPVFEKPQNFKRILRFLTENKKSSQS